MSIFYSPYASAQIIDEQQLIYGANKLNSTQIDQFLYALSLLQKQNNKILEVLTACDIGPSTEYDLCISFANTAVSKNKELFNLTKADVDKILYG